MWRDQLYNFELQPLPHIWDEVTRELDDEWLAVGKRLSTLESTPPPRTWASISRELGFEEQEQVLTPAVNRKKIIYSVTSIAAAVVLLVIVSYTFFLRKDTQPQSPIVIPAQASGTQPVTTPTAMDTTRLDRGGSAAKSTGEGIPGRGTMPNPLSSQTGNDQSASYTNETGLRSTPGYTGVDARNENFTSSVPLTHTGKIPNSRGELAATAGDDPAAQYFLHTLPDGRQVRISTKVLAVLRAMNDSSATKTSEWRSLLERWMDRLSGPDFIPSADNFMDIPGLLKLLEETSQGR